MVNKFSFNIYHSPFTIFYQEFKFFIVAIKYDEGHF